MMEGKEGTKGKEGKEVLLKIRASKVQEDDKAPKRGPILMEQALASMHALRKHHGVHISLEIGFFEGKICFFARTSPRAAALVESQIYAQYPDIDVERIEEKALEPREGEDVHVIELKLENPDIFPLKRYLQFDDILNRISVDPLSGITATLSQYSHPGMRGHIAIVFQPIWNRFRKRALRFLPLLNKGFAKKWSWFRNLLTRVHLARGWRRLALFVPDMLLGGFRSWFRIGMGDLVSPIQTGETTIEEARMYDVKLSGARHDREDELQAAQDKMNRLLYATSIQINVIAPTQKRVDAEAKLQEILGSFKQFDLPQSNALKVRQTTTKKHLQTQLIGQGFLLSNEELATLWHLPTVLVKTPNIDWVKSRKLEPPTDLPLAEKEQTLTVLGEAAFRGRRTTFGIRPDDRRRHVYAIGKTGMGKSTLLENMLFSDIQSGKGIAVIDPHGDLADSVLKMVPRERTNDVVLFDPADRDYPLSFNMLECRTEEQRPLIASGLMAVFTKLWPDVWSGRMEHILRNTLLALIESSGNSMLGIMRMYADDVFRKKIVARITDPLVKSFWEDEFNSWSEKFRTEAVAAIQNKVGQLLSTPLIRNIVGQVASTLDIRHAMDTGKIIIANLSKGKLGEDNSNFLGSMLVTKFQLDAMSRADVAERDRRDFYLYVDEFQNFATNSFATILSEARKYRLCLTMANQYIGQLTPDKSNTMLRDAVFGNVGTLVSFQIGSEDAEEIAEQFGDEKLKDDLIDLPKYHAYMRLMIDGVTSRPFSVAALPPPTFDQESGRMEKIRKLSRERYTEKRAKVEDNIKKWAASAKLGKEQQKSTEKAKEKEEEELKKAKKKGMKLEEYRKWRDREMWTNRLNQLKKVLGQGDPLSGEERAEMDDIEKKLKEAGGPTVEATDPTKGKRGL